MQKSVAITKYHYTDKLINASSDRHITKKIVHERFSNRPIYILVVGLNAMQCILPIATRCDVGDSNPEWHASLDNENDVLNLISISPPSYRS